MTQRLADEAGVPRERVAAAARSRRA